MVCRSCRERLKGRNSMDTTVIPLTELQADPEGLLTRCLDSGTRMVVELPDHRRVRIEPLEDEDDDLINDLIEHDPKFRALLARSLASGDRPFTPLSDLLPSKEPPADRAS